MLLNCFLYFNIPFIHVIRSFISSCHFWGIVHQSIRSLLSCTHPFILKFIDSIAPSHMSNPFLPCTHYSTPTFIYKSIIINLFTLSTMQPHYLSAKDRSERKPAQDHLPFRERQQRRDRGPSTARRGAHAGERRSPHQGRDAGRGRCRVPNQPRRAYTRGTGAPSKASSSRASHHDVEETIDRE